MAPRGCEDNDGDLKVLTLTRWNGHGEISQHINDTCAKSLQVEQASLTSISWYAVLPGPAVFLSVFTHALISSYTDNYKRCSRHFHLKFSLKLFFFDWVCYPYANESLSKNGKHLKLFSTRFIMLKTRIHHFRMKCHFVLFPKKKSWKRRWSHHTWIRANLKTATITKPYFETVNPKRNLVLKSLASGLNRIRLRKNGEGQRDGGHKGSKAL